MKLGERWGGGTRRSCGGVVVHRYDQYALYKCMKLSKNEKYFFENLLLPGPWAEMLSSPPLTQNLHCIAWNSVRCSGKGACRPGSHPGSATTHCDPQTTCFSLSLHHPQLLNGDRQARQSHSDPTHTGQTCQQNQMLITSIQVCGAWGR